MSKRIKLRMTVVDLETDDPRALKAVEALLRNRDEKAEIEEPQGERDPQLEDRVIEEVKPALEHHNQEAKKVEAAKQVKREELPPIKKIDKKTAEIVERQKSLLGTLGKIAEKGWYIACQAYLDWVSGQLTKK